MKNDITVISGNDPGGDSVIVVDTQGRQIKGVSLVAFKEDGSFGYFIQFVPAPQIGLVSLSESTDTNRHRFMPLQPQHRSDDFDVVNKYTGLVIGSYRNKPPLDEF